MTNVAELINQDLTVAETYLEHKKFDSINIIGNRILQNLFAMDIKELMIIGLVVKEVSSDLQQINAAGPKADKKMKIDKCKPFAKDCFEAIKLTLDDEESTIKIWNAYLDFEDKIREYQLVPEEREIYKDDYEFAKEATINYLNNLSSNKEYLLNRNIYPLVSTRAELATLINIHGGRSTIFSYMLTRAFEHVYKFALRGKVTDEEFESIVSTNINRLIEIVTLIQEGNEEELIEHANIMIGDLMYNYRKYFMLFGELKGELVEEISLSPEVSEKIQKIIQKSKSQ
jgi:hypothetical protein